jgi:hypothetical protein
LLAESRQRQISQRVKWPDFVETDQRIVGDLAHLFDRGCRLSMTGHGVWRDNAFVECLWRSVK